MSAAGETVATMTVLLFPPMLSFRSHVNVESRYGTKSFFPFPEAWSANFEITSPRVVRDLKDWEKELFFEIRDQPPLGTRHMFAHNNSDYKRLKSGLEKERAILDHPDLDGLNIVRVKEKYAYVEGNEMIDHFEKYSDYVARKKDSVKPFDQNLRQVGKESFALKDTQLKKEHKEKSATKSVEPDRNLVWQHQVYLPDPKFVCSPKLTGKLSSRILVFSIE